MKMDDEDFGDLVMRLVLEAAKSKEFVADMENGRVALWKGGNTIIAINKYGKLSATTIHTSDLYRDPTRHEAVVKMDDHLSTLNKEPEKYNPFENKGENNEN